MKYYPFLNAFLLAWILVNPLCAEDKEVNSVDEREEKDEDIAPPRVGFFSLPLSQQPSALFGFGGNIIEENEMILEFFADKFKGRNRTTLELFPGILFGVSENLSVFFNFPYTPLLENGCYRSRGLEDFFVQIEYGIYNKTNYCYEDQATLVASVYVPTGSAQKDPATGLGAPGFFIGGTFYRTYVDWVFFTANGALLPTQDRGIRAGEQFLYQAGVGRRIPSSCTNRIYALLLEVNGQYWKKNRNYGDLDPNSGGNTIYLTPSLWISSYNLIFQFGVSFPVYQNLFGNQRKFDYALNFNFNYSIY